MKCVFSVYFGGLLKKKNPKQSSSFYNLIFQTPKNKNKRITSSKELLKFKVSFFYSNQQVHEIMLRDRPRQTAYRDAIKMNELLFKGKTVLDVGCGTGILSVLCAKV